MSVTCVVYGADDAEIEELLRSPETIHRFLETAIPVERPGCMGTLLGRRPKILAATRPVFDLGKSWEAVHYVLNGTREEIELPNGFITNGGEQVGDEDVGYGPARVLSATRVIEIATFLESVSVPDFRSRINAKKMRPLHVYGAPRTDDPADAEYLVADFSALRDFIMARARRGEAIVIQYV